MGRVHAALLRPARAEGGVRPPARRGGPAARHLAGLLLGVVIWSATGGAALADTLTADAYRARLGEARALVVAARAASATQRDALLEQARVLLRRTSEVRVQGGVATIDDGPLADRIAPDTIDREIAELDRLIAFADIAASRRIDGAAADATLRELTQAQQASDRIDLARILSDSVGRIAVWVYDLIGRPDPLIVVRLQGIIGLLIAVSLVVLIVHGVRERIRRETVLGATASDRRADPSVHLRAADDALRAGHTRDAIHALYLYAFASLAAHEAIRYDPALTDHELLGRAAGIPHADALRDLVWLHERVWFGLRDAREPDAAAARALALQVVG